VVLQFLLVLPLNILQDETELISHEAITIKPYGCVFLLSLSGMQSVSFLRSVIL
jgi:hypothetical protein